MHINDTGLKEKKKVRFDLCSYSGTQQEMALKNFNPEAFLATWSEEFVPTEERPFARCLRAAFKISQQDAYEYRAQGVTTLDMAQAAINAKRKNGMHDWYHDQEGKPVCPSFILINPIFRLFSNSLFRLCIAAFVTSSHRSLQIP